MFSGILGQFEWILELREGLLALQHLDTYALIPYKLTALDEGMQAN